MGVWVCGCIDDMDVWVVVVLILVHNIVKAKLVFPPRPLQKTGSYQNGSSQSGMTFTGESMHESKLKPRWILCVVSRKQLYGR